jgi:hypothetical protein
MEKVPKLMALDIDTVDTLKYVKYNSETTGTKNFLFL